MIKSGSYFIATAGEKDDYLMIGLVLYKALVDIDIEKLRKQYRLGLLEYMLKMGLVERGVEFVELHLGSCGEIDYLFSKEKTNV